MPDPVVAYGSEDKPFHEAFGVIKEVHWGGVQAVKWYTNAYLDSATLADSQVGTLSMWIKLHDGAPFTIIQSGSDVGGSGDGLGGLSVELGAGGFTESRPDGGPFDVSIEAFFSAPTIYIPGDPEDDGLVPFQNMVVFADQELKIADTEKWYHFFMDWDTDAGTARLAVNGVVISNYTWPGNIFLLSTEWGGSPFTPNLSTGMSFFPFGVFRTDAEIAFSVADVWLDLSHNGIDLDKFVNVTTGRPRVLGPSGENPLTPAPTEAVPHPVKIKPDFFLHRKGGDAATFLENQGTAGDLTLTGDTPIVETDSPKFTP